MPPLLLISTTDDEFIILIFALLISYSISALVGDALLLPYFPIESLSIERLFDLRDDWDPLLRSLTGEFIFGCDRRESSLFYQVAI